MESPQNRRKVMRFCGVPHDDARKPRSRSIAASLAKGYNVSFVAIFCEREKILFFVRHLR